MGVSLEMTSRGNPLPQRHGFDSEIVRIGRSQECELAIPQDLELARKQCVLKWYGGLLLLLPIRATSPTRLNGSPVSRPMVLSPDDILSVGQQTIRVLFSPPKPSYPADAPTRLTFRIEQPNRPTQIITCVKDVARLCEGADSDIDVGPAKTRTLFAAETYEALIFWSYLGVPHLVMHPFSPPMLHNNEPIVDCVLLQEGDRIEMGDVKMQLLEVEDPGGPRRMPLGLFVFEGQLDPRYLFLARKRVVFGCGANADVVLTQGSFPPEFFAIEQNGNDRLLTPLTAAPTLYRNSEKIVKTARIEHGDHLYADNLVVYVDKNSPVPPKKHKGHRRFTLFAANDPGGGTLYCLYGDAAHIGSSPDFRFIWPSESEVFVDFWLLWHPSGTVCLHVGIWSADVYLDEKKTPRCEMVPVHIGSKIRVGKDELVVEDIIPENAVPPTSLGLRKL